MKSAALITAVANKKILSSLNIPTAIPFKGAFDSLVVAISEHYCQSQSHHQ